ncbi:MAG TPA: DNA gyrase inhibitor YacG [Pirellulales bacterium]|jgi:hypothetical protein|nr:DNA gyrase inhibitor YacG [Pirellulales bacterium]
MLCSICHRLFDPAESKAMPFCSPRCRQIDLGRWLGEEYRLDSPGDDEDGETEVAPIGDDPPE